MKILKTTLILISLIILCSLLWQATGQQNSNVTISVNLTPQQYNNLMTIATNRGLTVEQFLIETNNGLIISVRQQIIAARMRAAFDKFNRLTDAQKDRVLDLIESF